MRHRPDQVDWVGLDELVTFAGATNPVCVMTVVDRRTSCILAWAVEPYREVVILQRLIDEAPQANFYYSDLYATYQQLVYTPDRHPPVPGKSEIYHVEGNNAEMRHITWPG